MAQYNLSLILKFCILFRNANRLPINIRMAFMDVKWAKLFRWNCQISASEKMEFLILMRCAK